MQRIRIRDGAGADPARDRSLLEVVEALWAGALAAFPTDTVWGIGVRADDPRAVERLFALKGRDDRKPVACLVPSLAWVEAHWPVPLPGDLREEARRGWPGALTLVAPAPEDFLPAPRRGAPGLGLRVPDHAALRELLARLDLPLAASSANRSGQPVLTDAEAIARELGGQLDLLVELPGPAPTGRASRVVSFEPGGVQRTVRS